ncbi:forkhead box protein I3-like [Mytilus trossulus]|uniref:forkhead box protein I3-like n=1 Tax=Mytilus trossulus TaxID=6551 RepID=UPI0030059463
MIAKNTKPTIVEEWEMSVAMLSNIYQRNVQEEVAKSMAISSPSSFKIVLLNLGIMNNSQFSIYHLTLGDPEIVKRNPISRKGDGVGIPSLCMSESDSSYSNSAESITQVQLYSDRSIKHELSYRDINQKPSHSYVALISMAILSKPNKKMLLNDINQYIMDNFPFYNNKEKAWRNSIRHNLSLNECFVKSGRSDNGKSNYWSIHVSCMEEFAKGDFRRRNAKRRARKSSIKTADSSSNKFYTRNNNGYVPMTSSQIGSNLHEMKRSLMQTQRHNNHHIIQPPESTFGTTKTQFPTVMQSFGNGSSFPVAVLSSCRESFKAPSTSCTFLTFRPSFNSAFYSSCQK